MDAKHEVDAKDGGKGYIQEGPKVLSIYTPALEEVSSTFIAFGICLRLTDRVLKSIRFDQVPIRKYI